MKTAEELCKRTLERDEDNKKKGFSLIGGQKIQNKAEEERKKNKMKKREKQGIWDPAWCDEMRIPIWRDSKCDSEMDELRMEDQQSKIQDDGAKDAEHAGQD